MQREWLQQVRPAFISVILFTVIFGMIYPAVITIVNQLIFKDKANGSLIIEKETIRGSQLIGQAFTSPQYFWSRPSATDQPYNSAASVGSNLSPANPALLDRISQTIAQLRALDETNSKPIPIDLVTASASGLDPHISLAAALYQLPRVARARQLDEGEVKKIVNKHTEKRQFGFLGEPRVNVVLLNLDLDKLKTIE